MSNFLHNDPEGNIHFDDTLFPELQSCLGDTADSSSQREEHTADPKEPSTAERQNFSDPCFLHNQSGPLHKQTSPVVLLIPISNGMYMLASPLLHPQGGAHNQPPLVYSSFVEGPGPSSIPQARCTPQRQPQQQYPMIQPHVQPQGSGTMPCPSEHFFESPVQPLLPAPKVIETHSTEVPEQMLSSLCTPEELCESKDEHPRRPVPYDSFINHVGEKKKRPYNRRSKPKTEESPLKEETISLRPNELGDMVSIHPMEALPGPVAVELPQSDFARPLPVEKSKKKRVTQFEAAETSAPPVRSPMTSKDKKKSPVQSEFGEQLIDFGLSPKKKRPINAFMAFSSHMRSIRQEEGHTFENKYFIIEMAAKWREATPEFREGYKKIALNLTNNRNSVMVEEFHGSAQKPVVSLENYSVCKGFPNSLVWAPNAAKPSPFEDVPSGTYATNSRQ